MCGLWVWSCCPHLNLFESIFERTYRLMMNEIQRRVQLSRVIINIFTWRNGCPSSPTWDVILMNEKYVSIQLCNKHACCTWNLYLPWKDESAISSNFSVQVELSNWRVHWRSITLGADMTTRVSCFLSSSLRLDLRHTHLVMTIYYMQKSYPTPRRNESRRMWTTSRWHWKSRFSCHWNCLLHPNYYNKTFNPSNYLRSRSVEVDVPYESN